MSGLKDFRLKCSGCVFQQGLVPLDSGFQVTPMRLVSYQVSPDYHATAVVLLLKSSGCPQRMPEKSKEGLKSHFIPASQRCCDHACPCSWHFLSSAWNSSPGEQCCAIRRFIPISHCQWQPSENPGAERMVEYLWHCHPAPVRVPMSACACGAGSCLSRWISGDSYPHLS